MQPREYRVRVFVTDGRPGLIPFTYDVFATTRDDAVKQVRKNVRQRSLNQHNVKRVQSARLWFPWKRGKPYYENGQVH